MYKIEIFFQNDMKGIYTKEEETADNMSFAQIKVSRMIQRWAQNLAISVPTQVDLSLFKCSNLNQEQYNNINNIVMKYIQNHLEVLIIINKI